MARRRSAKSSTERLVDSGGAQRAIQGAITSSEIIATGVVNLVKNTMLTALIGAQDVGREVGTAAVTAARGSIRAAFEIGGDLGLVAKQAIKGTVQAASEIGEELGSVVRSATRGAVKGTNEVGGDVAGVARKAVEGTIEAAREIGADAGMLATKAAEGAIEAADRIGSAAGRAVRDTLAGTIAGVRMMIRETRNQRGAATPRPIGPEQHTARASRPKARGARKPAPKR